MVNKCKDCYITVNKIQWEFVILGLLILLYGITFIVALITTIPTNPFIVLLYISSAFIWIIVGITCVIIAHEEEKVKVKKEVK